MTGTASDMERRIEPDLGQARRTADMAHAVVIKLRQMDLPRDLDEDLASLSTDLGDLWSSQKLLAERLESLLDSPHDWEAVGDYLVDIRASLDHTVWHLKNVRKPLNRIATYAYRKGLDGPAPGEPI